MPVDRLTVMNDIFNDSEKNHRRSLNKSLKTLSQKSNVEVPVDRLTVMNNIFNDDRGISEWQDEKKNACKKRVHAKKKNKQKKKCIINALNKLLQKNK